MPVSAPKPEDDDPDHFDGSYDRLAGPVSDEYRENVRAATVITVVTVVVYISLVLIMAYMKFVWRAIPPVPNLTPTISVANGAAILAVISALVIALNVSARSIRLPDTTPAPGECPPGGEPVSDRIVSGYARYMILSQAALASGVLSILVGLGTAFSTLRGGELISALAVLLAALISAVISIDASAAMKEGTDLRSGIRRHRDTEDYRRLCALLGRPTEDGTGDERAPWSAARSAGWWNSRRGPRIVWYAADLALLGLLAATPALALHAADDIADGHFSWGYLPIIAISIVLSASVGAFVARIVADVVNRSMFAIPLLALLSALVIMWIAATLGALAIDTGSTVHRVFRGFSTASVVAVPLVLSVRVFRSTYSGSERLPGTSVRWMAWREIDRHATTLHHRLADAEESETTAESRVLKAKALTCLVRTTFDSLREEYRTLIGDSTETARSVQSPVTTAKSENGQAGNP
ncbi:hypothetical protein [Nocardia blacklockiae]|uniref:hypothetical protein n=1 Tax=Nocardia blacklockiae TaxID=480036 RepID=UPI001895D8F0|nr:hypothetical protein [Nocardia blacklockiae]MBF6171114.1 hypothetical protein [Nocardia blacklockiae]